MVDEKEEVDTEESEENEENEENEKSEEEDEESEEKEEIKIEDNDYTIESTQDEKTKIIPAFYMVYLNLQKFAYYRKLIPRDEFPKYDANTLKNQLISKKFAEFHFLDSPDHFKREETETTIIQTFGIETSYKSYNLKNIILKKISIPEKTKLDLIIINEGKVKANVNKLLHKYISEHKSVSVFVYNYKNLKIIVPEHESVPLHRIITPEEEEKVLFQLCCKKADLPKIFSYDPAIIWNGAIYNQIIEIHRISDVGIKALSYRIVI